MSLTGGIGQLREKNYHLFEQSLFLRSIFFIMCFSFLSLVRSFYHKLNVVFFVFHSNFQIYVSKKLIHFYLGIIWFGYHEIFSYMRLVCGNSKLRWLNKAYLNFLQTGLRESFETRESKLKLLSVSF